MSETRDGTHLVELAVPARLTTADEYTPSRVVAQVVALHRLCTREVYDHDDFTGNDEREILVALGGDRRRQVFVLALRSAPAPGTAPREGTHLPGLTGLPLLAGTTEIALDPAVQPPEVVASMLLSLPVDDNVHLVEGPEIQVVPGARRQGLGRVLQEQADAFARAHGRTVLSAWSTHAGHADDDDPAALHAPTGFGTLSRHEPAAAFALAQGYRLTQTERHSQLDLRPDLGELVTHLDRLEAKALRGAEGYVVHTWVERTPQPWVESMCRLRERMSTDVPQGEGSREAEVWTPERLEEQETRRQGMGWRMCTAAAEHEASGELVAYTEIETKARRPQVGFQGDTLVARAHRGHRLGLLVKIAALRHALTVSPELERIHTWNAGENAHMLSINEALGYTARTVTGLWEKDLDG